MFISKTNPGSTTCTATTQHGVACKKLVLSPLTRCPSHGGGPSLWAEVFLWLGDGLPPQPVEEVEDAALLQDDAEVPVTVALEPSTAPLQPSLETPAPPPVSESPAQQAARIAQLRGVVGRNGV